MARTFLPQILLVCYLNSCIGISATEDDSVCNADQYGRGCHYNCSSSCYFNKCRISHEKGVPECHRGCKEYHTGIFCQEFCPSLCLECNQTDATCHKCIDGYYGVTCNQTCDENCLNGTCHINGSCILALKTGMENKPRSANMEGLCRKMTEDGGVCQCCATGHRGDRCEQVCENCQTYYIPGKVCQYQCKAGYYGNLCNEECPEFCHQGNLGKPLCENTNGILQCLNGCKRGYTGSQCYQKCSENCELNTCYPIDGKCIDCPNGKYGDMCLDTCSSGCVNETCNRDGTCTDGCKTGMFGTSCNQTCPDTCITCYYDINIDLAICASDCKPGYHGFRCQHKCNEGCQGNTCNKVDGKCDHGCKPGYYDITCDQKCSEGCQDNTCTIEDGSCHRGCRSGFYLDNCTGICGINCFNNKCVDKFDGANPNNIFLCSEGCKDGYKGALCNHTCPEHCRVCNQLSDDGCMKCDDGYNLKSDDDGHSSCLKTDPELAISHMILTTIGISVVCTTVSVVIITLIIYKLLKKRRPSFSGSSLLSIGAGKSETENRDQVSNMEPPKRGTMEKEPFVKNRGTMEQEPLLKYKESNDQGNNRLIEACRNGKLEAVKTIFRQSKENINVRGRHGMTPIMEATGKEHTQVTDFLLQNGCDLSVVADNNNTVLHVACDKGNVELVKGLLDKKLFDINAKGNMGKSPLMIAARIGNKDLFDLLMREGADMNTRDNNNDTILHAACFNRNEAFLTYLQNQKVIKRFINLTGCKGRTPVMLAAYNGYKEMFDLLWKDPDRNESAKDDKKDNNDTILHVACSNDNAEFVGHLLSLKGFDIECKGCKGRTPAMIAVQNGCRKVFELLVEKGCDLSVTDEKSHNILTLACCTDNVAFVEYLLSLGTFDINTKGNKGRTPLLVAARNSCRKVFELLVEKGGDLSAIDDNGDCIQSLARGDFEKHLTTMNLFDEIIKA